MNKLLNKAAIIGVITSASIFSAAYGDVPSNMLPSFNNGTNVDVTSQGSKMNIKVTGGTNSVGSANWNSFNIGKDAHVNVEFTAHNQTSFNKVAQTGGLSEIYGKFTNSSSFSKGYENTGKVILLNPNGVLFGSGANVNLNSFTVSTMDGQYDTKTKSLILSKQSEASNAEITVKDGAEIYGGKNVSFASDNINIYSGSKISTNKINGANVKLITSDGVNFTYALDGAVKKISKPIKSNKPMNITVQGTIVSEDTEIINTSTNVKSSVNTTGMNKKATVAIREKDGSILLTDETAISKPETYEQEAVSSGMLISDEPVVEPPEIVEVSSGMLVADEPVIEQPEIVEVSSGMLLPDEPVIEKPEIIEVSSGMLLPDEPVAAKKEIAQAGSNISVQRQNSEKMKISEVIQGIIFSKEQKKISKPLKKEEMTEIYNHF